MSFTFDPYKLRFGDVSDATAKGGEAVSDLMQDNPTALSELERYWSNLPRKQGVPMRKDVDPAQMGSLLEDSFILERVAPGVARIRVAGRNVAKLLGIEPRGLPLTAAFLPASRPVMSRHLETAFTSPGLVELALESPRAVGQPALHGKILLLPLRDDHGHVSRMIGVLVMSGRRGMGGRRFSINETAPVRFEPTLGLQAVEGGRTTPHLTNHKRPSLAARPALSVATSNETAKKADDKPALRLVVSNS